LLLLTESFSWMTSLQTFIFMFDSPPSFLFTVMHPQAIAASAAVIMSFFMDGSPLMFG
jgi:hypothetical protein